MENVSLFRSCNLQLNSPTVNAQFLRIGFPRPKHWDCGRIDLRPGSCGKFRNTLLKDSGPIFDLCRSRLTIN